MYVCESLYSCDEYVKKICEYGKLLMKKAKFELLLLYKFWVLMLV